MLRQFVGKLALLGMESLDYWNQVVNDRVLHNEVKKLDAKGASANWQNSMLQLLQQAAEEEGQQSIPPLVEVT